MSKIRIDSQLCKKCGGCVEICPEAVFAQRKKNSVPYIKDESACISCGHCIDTCPAGAITHRDFKRDQTRSQRGFTNRGS